MFVFIKTIVICNCNWGGVASYFINVLYKCFAWITCVNEFRSGYQQAVMNSVDSYMQNIYIMLACCLSN